VRETLTDRRESHEREGDRSLDRDPLRSLGHRRLCGQGETPAPDDPAREIVDYYFDNSDAQAVASAALARGCVALVIGIAGLTPLGFFAFLATGIVIVWASLALAMRADTAAGSSA
jgi:hypothetical protein